MLVSVPGGIRCVILWAIPSLSSRVYHTLRVYPVSPFLPSRLTLTLPAIKSEMILRAAGEEVKLKAKPSWAQLYPSTASCLDQSTTFLALHQQAVGAHVVLPFDILRFLHILRPLEVWFPSTRDEKDLRSPARRSHVGDGPGLACSFQVAGLGICFVIISASGTRGRRGTLTCHRARLHRLGRNGCGVTSCRSVCCR